MNKIMVIILLSLCAMVCVGKTAAQYQFASSAQQQQFSDITHQLRCLVCQNEDLWDSQAKLAADLRAEVASMVQQGQSNQQIKAYMVARYGDFILYKPRLDVTTYLLWFGPLVAILIGLWIVISSIYQNNKRTLPKLSEAQQAKLDLLQTKGEQHD